MREAEIEELWIKIDGQLVSNIMRYADDTAVCAESQQREAERLIEKLKS